MEPPCCQMTHPGAVVPALGSAARCRGRWPSCSECRRRAPRRPCSPVAGQCGCRARGAEGEVRQAGRGLHGSPSALRAAGGTRNQSSSSCLRAPCPFPLCRHRSPSQYWLGRHPPSTLNRSSASLQGRSRHWPSHREYLAARPARRVAHSAAWNARQLRSSLRVAHPTCKTADDRHVTHRDPGHCTGFHLPAGSRDCGVEAAQSA